MQSIRSPSQFDLKIVFQVFLFFVLTASNLVWTFISFYPNYFNFQVFSPFGTPQTHSLVTDGLYRRGNIGKLLGNKTKQNHEAYQETLP